MIFLLACIALLLISGAYLSFALTRSARQENVDPGKSLYQQRLRELQEDIEAGEIRAELEKAAADDIVRVTLDDEKTNSSA